MTEFATRLRRVRLKGGADVTVLRSQSGIDGADDWRGAIVRNAKKVAEQGTDDSPLVGYLLIGFFGDGQTSVGYRYDPAATPVPRMLMPAWVAEIIRRDMITGPEARDVFNEMFEWVDGGPRG